MKFLRIKGLLFCLTLLMFNGIAYSQNIISLSLDDAIEMALLQNADVAISKRQIQRSTFALKEANGSFLPKLYLSGNYNRNIDRPVIFLPEGFGTGSTVTKLGSDNDFRGSLNLSVPVYSNYNLTNKKSSAIRLNYQNEVARGIQQSVLNNTKKAYFNFLIAQEVVQVQQNRLKNAQEIIIDIQKRVKLGTLTEYDLTSAKVKMINAKSALLETESSIIPIGNSLKLLLGLQVSDIIELTAPMTIIEDELVLDVDVNEMLAQNSKLRQLDIDIELNENQIKLAKSAFHPSLDAVGNYAYQTQANDFKFSDYNWVNTSLLGLQLQFNLFNGSITKNKVQQATIGKEIAQDQKKLIQREYQMKHTELLSQLSFSQQKVEVEKENLDLTEEALSLTKKRYQFGTGTFLEMNDAELSYTQARLSWIQAISNYKTAYYDFELLIGKE